MFNPYQNPKVLEALKDVYESRDWWKYKGQRADDLEKKFAHFHDSEFAVSVCNGSVALDIIFKAIGLKEGDEVILPAYDFYSLPKSVMNFGATPVFVDVNPDNFTLDSTKIGLKISKNTKAVIAVHIDGSIAEIDRISSIAKEKNIVFIEDCAQAHGGIYKNKKVGSYGDFSLFSFGGVKLITTGQGGMILCKNQEDFHKCYAITNRGLMPNKKTNPFGLVGENYQLSEIQSAMALAQLEELDEFGEKRELAMNFLDSQLGKLNEIEIFKQFKGTQRRAQMRYSFKVDATLREEILLFLQGKKLSVFRGYNTVKGEERLQGLFKEGEGFPNAQNAQNSILSVFHPFLLKDEDGLQELVDGVKEFFLQ